VTATAIPEEKALRDPGGACVADERQELDNTGFAGKVTAVAALFAAAGLRSGGVLAIMLPNRAELVTSMFAASFWATVERARPTFCPRSRPSKRCSRPSPAHSPTPGACALSSAGHADAVPGVTIPPRAKEGAGLMKMLFQRPFRA
jgi:hypothetical protein